jgi:hypothetical protein
MRNILMWEDIYRLLEFVRGGEEEEREFNPRYIDKGRGCPHPVPQP